MYMILHSGTDHNSDFMPIEGTLLNIINEAIWPYVDSAPDWGSTNILRTEIVLLITISIYLASYILSGFILQYRGDWGSIHPLSALQLHNFQSKLFHLRS